MTSLDTRTPGSATTTGVRPIDRLAPVVGAAAVAAAIAALVLPNVTGGGDMGGMSMTHYMGLLAANQPWNLLVFMALPVILAETLAITELVILFSKNPPTYVRALNRAAGLVIGPLMVGIGVYLFKNAIIPLTTSGGWAGPADLIAVGCYALSALPLIGITLVELGILGRASDREARKLHATFVGIFLVVGHIAMIFGMLDPTIMGWNPSHVMPDGAVMPGMNH